MSKPTTNVSKEEVTDLDALLSIPGADVIMTNDPAGSTAKKPSFFKKGNVDMSVFDDPADPNEPVDPAPVDPVDPAPADPTDPVDPAPADPVDPVDPPANPDSLEDIISSIEPTDPNEDPSDPANKGGRPPLDKGGMSQLVNKLIEGEHIVPFNDDKPMEDYTMDDFVELITANITHKTNAVREEVPGEFFDSLPEKLQLAAKYVADGGQDLEGMFMQLAATEQIQKLDANNPDHHERIVRDYLTAKQFGSAEEIEEEIDSYRDLDKLGAKANQFKPKLDTMQEQIVQQKLQQQEGVRKQQQQAAMNYANSIYDILKEGKLGEVTLNPKIQNMLYSGLVQTNYPSRSGKPTNMLGHLLEKHQFVEPNHELIAEALWLLQDPAGYKAEISKGVKNDVVESTVRTLKTEQANKAGSGLGSKEERGSNKRGKKTLERPSQNFFARNK